MKVAAICPTYKRPDCLRNAIVCFLRQQKVRHGDELRMFILDDAQQFEPESTEAFEVITCERLPSLPAKFNRLIEEALQWEADIVMVWEDDDVYLSNHVANVVEQVADEIQVPRPHLVYGTYGQAKGWAIVEKADGRFHGAMAYTAEALLQLREFDGEFYSYTEGLSFDQCMMSKCDKLFPDDAAKRKEFAAKVGQAPSYIYRWGNPYYHGSAQGESGYAELWAKLETMHAPKQPFPIVPKLDLWASLLIQKYDPMNVV